MPSEYIEIHMPQPPAPPSDPSLHKYTPHPRGDRWILAFDRGERPTMYLCRLPIARTLNGTTYIGLEEVCGSLADALSFQTEAVAGQWAEALNDPKRGGLGSDWLCRSPVDLEPIE